MSFNSATTRLISAMIFLLVVLLSGSGIAYAKPAEITVIHPTPGPGSDAIPIGENQEVTIKEFAGMVVIQVKDREPEPDFTVTQPSEIISEFHNSPSIEHTYKNNADGSVTVTSKYSEDGDVVVITRKFPVGSVVTESKRLPQPEGAKFETPDAIALSDTNEAELLALLSITDLPGSQAFKVPSGNLLFSTNEISNELVIVAAIVFLPTLGQCGMIGLLSLIMIFGISFIVRNRLSA